MIQLTPRSDGYDERHWLSLKGLGPMGEGEFLKLNLGESVLCGRSRHCGWSLKRTPYYLETSEVDRARLRAGMPWRTTSRRHCRITYIAPDMVDIENLSPNGTLVDGHRVDRIVLTDCRRSEHRVQLGPQGVELQLSPGALPIDVRAEVNGHAHRPS